MCSALTNCDAYDFYAAVFTGLAFAVVGSKMVLEFSAAIDPVDGRAVAADALGQHHADRFMQTGGLPLFY